MEQKIVPNGTEEEGSMRKGKLVPNGTEHSMRKGKLVPNGTEHRVYKVLDKRKTREEKKLW